MLSYCTTQCINVYMWNLEKWCWWTYLQSRNKDTDIGNKHMNTKWGKSGRDKLEDWDWHIYIVYMYLFSSVQFIRSVVSDSLRPHESQHARPPCPSPFPGVHSNSSPSSLWCHPAISSSVVPFSSCPQSLPASESFPMYLLVCIK